MSDASVGDDGSRLFVLMTACEESGAVPLRPRSMRSLGLVTIRPRGVALAQG